MFKHTKQGAVDIVHCDGVLNIQSMQEATELLDDLTGHGQPRIVFAMDGVALLDSAGLELLLDSLDRCHSRGGDLKLAAPNTLCRDILEITDVARRFEIFDDAVKAAGSFVN